MTSRDRFEAWYLAENDGFRPIPALEGEGRIYASRIIEAQWHAWQARDAEVAAIEESRDRMAENAAAFGESMTEYRLDNERLRAEVARLVEALREARECVASVCIINFQRKPLLEKVDALLREYTPNEKQG